MSCLEKLTHVLLREITKCSYVWVQKGRYCLMEIKVFEHCTGHSKLLRLRKRTFSFYNNTTRADDDLYVVTCLFVQLLLLFFSAHMTPKKSNFKLVMSCLLLLRQIPNHRRKSNEKGPERLHVRLNFLASLPCECQQSSKTFLT